MPVPRASGILDFSAPSDRLFRNLVGTNPVTVPVNQSGRTHVYGGHDMYVPRVLDSAVQVLGIESEANSALRNDKSVTLCHAN